MISSPLMDEIKPLVREVEPLRHQIQERYNRDAIVVESAQMHLVLGTAQQLAKTDAIALIQGESGTGKEVIAKAIHAWSQRAEHPFIIIDCTTLPETLMESELFGHEKGAFTGALVAKRGLFEEGNRGTIFLDEVGDMPLPAQVKLLRVLQERTIRRVGGTMPLRIDVRILAATNQDLKTLVGRKAFREDLYYRLNGITITIPPLRERREDIPALAHHLLKVFSHRVGRQVEGISSEAMAILLRHPWPGNVRELEKIIERAVVLGRSERIVPEDLPASLFGRDDFKYSSPKDRVTLAELEKAHILAALSAHQWNQTKVAEELGISRTTLWRKLKKYHIDVLS
jgi:transcriptional regulator with PAS, ATPase and Fis domain